MKNRENLTDGFWNLRKNLNWNKVEEFFVWFFFTFETNILFCDIFSYEKQQYSFFVNLCENKNWRSVVWFLLLALLWTKFFCFWGK